VPRGRRLGPAQRRGDRHLRIPPLPLRGNPFAIPAITETACLQAMHLVLPDGTILAGEKALPEIVRRTRRFRRAAVLFRIPGAGLLSRFLYRAFADRRHRIAKRLFP